jgi:hypothetical protein
MVVEKTGIFENKILKVKFRTYCTLGFFCKRTSLQKNNPRGNKVDTSSSKEVTVYQRFIRRVAILITGRGRQCYFKT